MTLNREALLATAKCPTEKVTIPQGTVIVRGMTGRELIAFQRSVTAANGKAVDDTAFPAKLLVCCLVDEKGQRLLKDEDWEAVLNMPGAVVQKLTTVALRLCGYGDEGNL